MNSASLIAVDAVTACGDRHAATRMVADEVPIAIECNGLGYAVLMASPSDVTDLVYGFALSERLIDTPADIRGVDVHEGELGIIARVALAERCSERVLGRVRHRATDASCGLCGIENLEQAMRPLPPVSEPWSGDDTVIFAALDGLGLAQPLNVATRAVHAAAACARDGKVQLVREDVGRHNAFDKLIGAMARQGARWDGGFALLTSRCSYELVEKAVLSGCPMLATISAPTGLAVMRARSAGLTLRALVRPDALLAIPCN